MNRLRHHRGAALVMALLVVALVATLATVSLERTDLWLGQTRSRQDYMQALLLAHSGIDYARAVLAEDARTSGMDNLGEAWAIPAPRIAMEGNEITGYIEDQQGLWNLNNLAPQGRAEPRAIAVFRRLLEVLTLPPTLADRLTAALDGSYQPTVGAGNSAPVNNPLANNPSNPPEQADPTMLTDLGNLRHVPGFDSAVIERLRPYVTVLPGLQPVNLNTAPAAVLAALVPGLDLATAETLVNERKTLWYRDLAEFRSHLARGLAPAPVALGVNSRYFLAHATVRRGNSVARVNALLDRSAGGALPDIVWQTLQ